MRLALITAEGEVLEVSDCIDEYNLDKPIARADVIERIQRTIAHHQDDDETTEG
jgi:hypothetical protein